MPFYYLYSRIASNKIVYMYTINSAERQHLLNLGWQGGYTFVNVWNYPAPGTVPLYRSFAPGTGDHLFTINEQERYAAGYTYEGIACYVRP